MTSFKPKSNSAKNVSSKSDQNKAKRIFITLTAKEQHRLSLLFVLSDFKNYNAFLKDKLFFDARALIKSKDDSFAFYSRLTCLYQEFHFLAQSYSELVQNQDTLVYQQKELLYFLIRQTKKLAFLSKKIVTLIQEFKALNPLKQTVNDSQY